MPSSISVEIETKTDKNMIEQKSEEKVEEDPKNRLKAIIMKLY